MSCVVRSLGRLARAWCGSQPARMTPVGAVVRGLLAGAVGTAAMDAVLFARYRRGGGESGFKDWEFSAGLSSWEDAPAPAQVGKRLWEGLFRVELPPTRSSNGEHN
jgi:hypothetical protein